MVRICLCLVGDMYPIAQFDTDAFVQVFQLKICLKQSILGFLLQLY